jgi:hypothetical protein
MRLWLDEESPKLGSPEHRRLAEEFVELTLKLLDIDLEEGRGWNNKFAGPTESVNVLILHSRYVVYRSAAAVLNSVLDSGTMTVHELAWRSGLAVSTWKQMAGNWKCFNDANVFRLIGVLGADVYARLGGRFDCRLDDPAIVEEIISHDGIRWMRIAVDDLRRFVERETESKREST